MRSHILPSLFPLPMSPTGHSKYLLFDKQRFVPSWVFLPFCFFQGFGEMKTSGKRRWDGPSSERQQQIDGPVQESEEILTDHVLFCLLSRMTAGAKMTAETFGESARHGEELL